MPNWSGFIHFLVWNGINKIWSWIRKWNLSLLHGVIDMPNCFIWTHVYIWYASIFMLQDWLLTVKVNISEEMFVTLKWMCGQIFFLTCLYRNLNFKSSPIHLGYGGRFSIQFLGYGWIVFWFEITYTKATVVKVKQLLTCALVYLLHATLDYYTFIVLWFYYLRKMPALPRHNPPCFKLTHFSKSRGNIQSQWQRALDKWAISQQHCVVMKVDLHIILLHLVGTEPLHV